MDVAAPEDDRPQDIGEAPADVARRGAETGRAPRRLDRRTSIAVVVGLWASALGLVARWWIRSGAAPLLWNDSADYLLSASASLWSLERLAGARPLATPSLLAAFRGDADRFVLVQAVLAALSWGLLAGIVARCFRTVGRQVIAGALILALSLTWQITMWDQQVLTESNALTGLALVTAALVAFGCRPSPWTGTGLVLASACWLATRDSHLVSIAIGGAALLVLAALRPRWRTRTVALTGAFLVALAFLTAGAADHGHRDRLPIEHVYAVRVLPYPDRVAWFADHGMPDAAELEAIGEAEEGGPGGARFTPVPAEPRWDRWRSWLDRSGRATLAAYVASHPGYVVTEPLEDPQRVFNNGAGLATYRPLELHEVPALATVFYPSTWMVVVTAIVAATVIAVRRVRWAGVGSAGLALVATALPHALAVWHSDGMESTRHLLIPGVQGRLGTLLLVIAAVLGQPDAPGTAAPEPEMAEAATGTGPSLPARSPDHRPAPDRPRG